MESNFNNREFEQYVKRNADQYRMIPSEKEWRGINNVLHTRGKWYGAGLTLLLLVTAVSVTWGMVSYPASKTPAPASSARPDSNEHPTSTTADQATWGSPLGKSSSNWLWLNKINEQ